MRGFGNTLRRLMAAKKAIGELPEISEYTATGNPATFTTNLARALTEFEIPLLPVQSGSGTPSPDNVRPIRGWSGVTVVANGQTFLAAWEPVAGVVYGGTVDLVTGVMTVDRGYVLFNGSETESWQIESISAGINFYISVPDAKTSDNAGYEMICNSAAARTKGDTYAQGQCFISDFKNFNLAIGTIINVNSVNDFKTWLAENNVQLVYKLDTPQTVRLTPLEIKTIIGQNSIATATGGTNTIKYLKRG